MKKSGVGVQEFDKVMESLVEKLEIVSDDSLDPFMREAASLVADIDPDDAVVVACALSFPGSVIWSDDKALKKVRGIRVLNTEEMMGRMRN